MKKHRIISAVVLAVTLVFVKTPTPVQAAGSFVLYRLYNPYSGEHFYTASAAERNNLYNIGWNYEGVAWASPNHSSTPVYRLYNPYSSDHHYTTSAAERDMLVPIGWIYEGIAFYSDSSNSRAVYRLFNPYATIGTHHYTTSYDEAMNLVPYGWIYEGVAWYSADVSDASSTVVALPDITNTASYATIEADVYLNGGGSGCHSKIVFQTATAAMSLGIQYDVAACDGYAGRAGFLVENVANNGPGGQSYTHYGFCNLNEWHHLMMAYQTDGTVDFYIDQRYVGSQRNVALATTGTLYCSVEGAARLDGDIVDAQFRNVRIKGGGTYDPNRGFNCYPVDRDNGLGIDTSGVSLYNRNVRIVGQMTNLNGRDWDSAYEQASDVVRFSDGL